MQKVHLTIEGMSCGHCVARVRAALQAVEGIEVTSVQVGSAVAEIDPARTTPDDLIRAVDDAGYTANLSATRAA
jgi:copper chaperone CopZ